MDNLVLRQVLLGCYDDGSPLRHLRNQRGMLELIFGRLVSAWEAHVDTTTRGFLRLGLMDDASSKWIMGLEPQMIRFPQPWPSGSTDMTSFHVNMMPFVMGDYLTLPHSCQRYHGIIDHCLRMTSSREFGKVGYLTIHESTVEAGTTQRRGGLHIELGGGGGESLSQHIHWGLGQFDTNCIHGGIFMASTISNSCAVYDAVIQDVETAVDPLGGVDHLRPALAKRGVVPRYLEANELVWMTDRTPHEALPLPTAAFRQYFRLITSGVSHWFADHSTPNPLGIEPAATIVHGNKFPAKMDASKAPQRQLSTSSVLHGMRDLRSRLATGATCIQH